MWNENARRVSLYLRHNNETMMYLLTTFVKTILSVLQRNFVDRNPRASESAAELSTPRDTFYFIVRNFPGKNF